MINKLILTLLCSFIAIAPIFSNKKSTTYEVIKPVPKEEAAEIIKEIKQKINWDKIHDYQESDISTYEDWYIVDINNDGQPEYVSFASSRRYDKDLIIFGKDGNKLKLIKNICQVHFPASVHAKYRFDYKNPITGKAEHFVKVDGKVYIFARNNCGNFACNRQIFFWKNNKCLEMSNSFWVKEQRLLFKQLYTDKRYHDAFNLLSDFESNFSRKIDPNVNLWILSEISLATLRCNKPADALNYIQRIKNSKDFVKATPALIRAIVNNEKLALNAIKEDQAIGTKGKYNYDWLLEFKNEIEIVDFNGVPLQILKNIANDKRFADLLTAVVPNVQENKHKSPSYDEIKFNLANSPATNFKVINDRYVSFNGWSWVDRGHMGFFWCDLKDKVSLVAIGEMQKSSNSCETSCGCPEIQYLYITSRSLLFNEIPKQFFKDLDQWIKQADNIDSSNIVFDDRLGKRTEINFKKSEINKDIHSKEYTERAIAFVNALNDNNICEAQALLYQGINYDAKCMDTVEAQPLHVAAARGSIDLVITLISQGANVNAKSANGRTALHWDVSDRNNNHIAYNLIRFGVELNAQDKWGDTALHLAASNNNKEMVELLLNLKCLVNIKNNIGYTPLHSNMYLGNPEIIELLLKFGADINAKCHGNQTPLHLAATYSRSEAVKKLLEYNADTSIKTKDCPNQIVGRTALDFALDEYDCAIEYLARTDLDSDIEELEYRRDQSAVIIKMLQEAKS